MPTVWGGQVPSETALNRLSRHFSKLYLKRASFGQGAVCPDVDFGLCDTSVCAQLPSGLADRSLGRGGWTRQAELRAQRPRTRTPTCRAPQAQPRAGEEQPVAALRRSNSSTSRRTGSLRVLSGELERRPWAPLPHVHYSPQIILALLSTVVDLSSEMLARSEASPE